MSTLPPRPLPVNPEQLQEPPDFIEIIVDDDPAPPPPVCRQCGRVGAWVWQYGDGRQVCTSIRALGGHFPPAA